jgi:hypothetical protein
LQLFLPNQVIDVRWNKFQKKQWLTGLLALIKVHQTKIIKLIPTRGLNVWRMKKISLLLLLLFILVPIFIGGGALVSLTALLNYFQKAGFASND